MDSPEARKLVKEEFIDLRNKDLTRRITNILHGYYLDLRKYHLESSIYLIQNQWPYITVELGVHDDRESLTTWPEDFSLPAYTIDIDSEVEFLQRIPSSLGMIYEIVRGPNDVPYRVSVRYSLGEDGEGIKYQTIDSYTYGEDENTTFEEALDAEFQDDEIVKEKVRRAPKLPVIPQDGVTIYHLDESDYERIESTLDGIQVGEFRLNK